MNLNFESSFSVNRPRTLDNSLLDSVFSEIVSSLESSTFKEQADVIEFGFSFESSLKNIAKYLLYKLAQNFNQDLVKKFAANYKDALAGNLNQFSQQDLNLFNNIILEVKSYFKDQFISHLGEKINFNDSDFNVDVNLKSFIKDYGLKKRHFEYSLKPIDIAFLMSSVLENYKLKKNNREKQELLNILFFNFALNKDNAKKDLLYNCVIELFPELQPDLFNIYNQTLELKDGDSLVEISPPYYDYQSDYMVRVYKYVQGELKVDLYSIPSKDRQDLATKEIVYLQNFLNNNGLEYNLSLDKSLEQSNKTLSKIYKTNLNSQSIINSVALIADIGGINKYKVIQNALTDVLELEQKNIENFFDLILPNLFTNDLTNFAQNYKNLFLILFAKYDSNFKQENPAAQKAINNSNFNIGSGSSAEILSALRNVSNDQVNGFSVKAAGACDLVSGSVGNVNVQNQTIAVAEATNYAPNQVTLATKETTLLGAKEDLQIELNTYKDANGNEVKLFTCPVCMQRGVETLVDICSKSCAICNVTLEDLRKASEGRALNNFVNDYAQNSRSINANNQVMYSRSTSNTFGKGIWETIFNAFFGWVNI